MIKTSFKDYLSWRQCFPDSMTMLSLLGIDLFEPTPAEMKRWVALNKGRHYRHRLVDDDDAKVGGD